MITKCVWLVSPDTMFERDWIYELLSLSGLTHFIDVLDPVILENAIVIFNHSVDYMSFFRQYEAARIPFVAFHLSDETLGDDFSFYSYKSCRHVFRNYWHPYASPMKNVTTFGLGYKTGFKKLRSGADRKYNWCFAGNVHNDVRYNFLQAFVKMKSLEPYYVHTTLDGFNSADGLSIDEYTRILSISKFALCPPGQGNLDTFRFYEALEADSIPVVLSQTAVQSNYWTCLFSALPLPFITADNPESAAELCEALLRDEDALAQRLLHQKQFWTEQKKKWADALSACFTQ